MGRKSCVCNKKTLYYKEEFKIINKKRYNVSVTGNEDSVLSFLIIETNLSNEIDIPQACCLTSVETLRCVERGGRLKCSI